ncbi:MAG: type I-B CRISPR-associated protein Cas7/Csh2 [Candidatus Marinimicrobia bacterium]|nr:type I-B CRISPR-associated protein Cas7/Csh2 [Candidatus Neomarinimicrobiota bacterium]MDD5583232.1 type I-B CRISPR-associated protein Cas7/Csh2 [Candidatus Neomarinimicrobiota bacterium]
MSELTKRSEILFLYDVQNNNPNGDPNDENKPRYDEESGRNLVTDVRLKRTIRDYLKDYKNQNIFVQEIVRDDGTIQDGKSRAKDFGKTKQEILDNVLKECIDIRLFGATIPMDKDSITFTGPVQFKMGKSLHTVKIVFLKGTGAFASKETATKKTFREEYILPYSMIAFHGIINENAAKHTQLSEQDVEALKEAIWLGTKNLISRSKFGQMPRMLMIIQYHHPNFYIGDLDNLIKLIPNEGLREEEIRSLEDYTIDFTELLKQIELHQDKIDKIELAIDPKLMITSDNKPVSLKELKNYQELTF